MALILLAEDDHATRNFVCQALESDGHDVTAVLDGGDALKQLTAGSKTYDLLVADVNMPVIDGMELVERISDQGLSLPILLMTGEASSLSNRANITDRAAGVLIKPFTLEKIREEVRAALNT